jgi:hypothetical protein
MKLNTIIKNHEVTWLDAKFFYYLQYCDKLFSPVLKSIAIFLITTPTPFPVIYIYYHQYASYPNTEIFVASAAAFTIYNPENN